MPIEKIRIADQRFDQHHAHLVFGCAHGVS
jgi:hypothetical protein